MNDLILTKDEGDKVIKAFLCSRKAEGATEEEVQAVLDWATEAKLYGIIFQLILKEEILVDWRDGKAIYKHKEHHGSDKP